MKKMMLLLFTFIILVGCSNTNETNDDLTPVTEAENDVGVENAESVENEEELPPALTEEEAQEIVFDHFLERNIAMRELMDDIHTRDDYQLVYDNTTSEYAALEAQIEDIFTPHVAKDKVKKLAELYAEINTCECDSFSTITPNMINVKFNLEEQDTEYFIVSFIELGEEYNPSHGTHIAKFVNEDDTWKFSESEFKAYTKESFNLSKTDIANSGFDFSTQEVIPMNFIEYRTVDGEELIVMENRGTYAGYNIQSGEIHVFYDY